ncbi:MAG: MFS transporter [Actinobacteria bacterium]|nr:MFS transporter [Actinomycetota bacterium]MCL5674753.1 MFS transporter [Candidatus Omnitrophota bacterium]
MEVSVRKKSITNFLIGQGFNQAYTNVVFGGVLTLFLLKIGAREIMLGFLAILGPIIGVLSIFSISFVQKKYERYINSSAIIMAILGFLLLPVFFLAGKISYGFLIIYYLIFLVIYLISNQIFSIAFMPTVTNLVPENERGVFFGRLRFFIMFLSLMLFYFVSKMLGKSPQYIEFFWIFLILAVLQAVAPAYFSKVIYSPRPPEETDKVNILEGLKIIFREKNLKRFFSLLFINTFLTGLVGPFLIPFLKLRLGLSDSFCILLQTITILGYALSVYAWGEINDKRGSRFVLFSSLLYAPVFWFILANLDFFPGQYISRILIVLYFFSGISNAGFLMAVTTRRMTLAPPSEKISFYSNLMIFGEQFPMIISSPLAGFILQRNKNFTIGQYTIYPLLFIFTGFAGMYLLFKVLKMEALEEKPLKEIFTEVISQNLLKFKDIITSPP